MSNKHPEYVYDPAKGEPCKVCGLMIDQKCRPIEKMGGFVCERTRKFYEHVVDDEGEIVWPINT